MQIDWKRAKEIIGKNFFGVEDWSAFYGVKFSEEQISEAAEFPWGEDILNSTCPFCRNVVKHCHFAFLGLESINGEPLTIMKLQKLHPATGQPRFNVDAWYSKEEFAREATMDFRWYLIHKSMIPKSRNKTYDDQEAILTTDYEVPSAVTEVTKDLLVFRKTGTFVNSTRWARCKCVTSDGGRVVVGFFGKHGLTINSFRDLDGHYLISLAASRTLEEVFSFTFSFNLFPPPK